MVLVGPGERGMGGTGNATTFGRVGALLAIGFGVALIAACGEVTANGAEETRLCGEESCAGKHCPPPRQAKDEIDAGARCTAGDDGAAGGGSGTAPGSAGTTGAGGGVPTEVAEFPCTICRK